MYDHDVDEVGRLGWEEFITRQWESIFVGYRSTVGLRRTCRRWSDLLQVGLGCSQDIADLLVRAEIVQRADRDLEGTRDAGKLLTGMDQVLADVRIDLIEMDEIPPEQVDDLLQRQARLRALARRLAFGLDAGDGPEVENEPGTGNPARPTG
ncbi:MAG TPA: hypothetical protein VH307_15375 [Streptosporangiaceae bacterium]|nr:hypothetical protein [Streptosporangiaceae bacterium]